MNNVFLIASLACLLAAVMTLARGLPAQNVVFIIVFLVAIEVAVEYWSDAEDLRTGALFWPGAVIWFRLGAKRLLKPWRQSGNYGFLLIGLASLAAAGLQTAFTPGPLAAGRFFLTAVCLTLLVPWFLQKRFTISGEPKEEGSTAHSPARRSRWENGS